MEILECESYMQKLTNQLQSLQLFLDKESLDDLRIGLFKNIIDEIKEIYFLSQNDDNENPIHPVVIKIILGNGHIDISNNRLKIGLGHKINYLVYFNGKLVYTLNEDSKNINLFLDDLLNKKQINISNNYI